MNIESWTVYGYVIHNGEEKVALLISRKFDKYKFVNENSEKESRVYKVWFGANTKLKSKLYEKFVLKQIDCRQEKFMKNVK